MSFIRVIAVDPRPRPGENDLRVYQVPEFSREQELLQELFTSAGIEFTVLESGQQQAQRKRRKVK